MLKKVRELIMGYAGAEESMITDNAHLVDDLEMDSVDLMELTVALEEEYGIVISDEDSESLLTVKAVEDYVENAVKNR